MKKIEFKRYRNYYAKCKCQKYVACDFIRFYLDQKAQEHANKCGNPVVIGECPPNICYSDQIFHFKTIYPKPQQ